MKATDFKTGVKFQGGDGFVYTVERMTERTAFNGRTIKTAICTSGKSERHIDTTAPIVSLLLKI